MLLQFKYFIWLFIHLPLLPLVAFQGYRLKKSIPMLPGASKNIVGTVGSGDQEINIVTIGESAFAGVGVDDHQHGVSGQLAKALSENKRIKVNWQVVAESGFNVKKVHSKLVAKLPAHKIDYIIIGLGANDTFELNSPLNWLADFKMLIYAIRLKHPDCPIIISPLPPVGEFPAFSGLMKQLFGNLAYWYGLALLPIEKHFQHVYYMNQQINCDQWLKHVPEAENIYHFFSDGIHPSPLAYSLWGKEISKFIINNKLI